MRARLHGALVDGGLLHSGQTIGSKAPNCPGVAFVLGPRTLYCIEPNYIGLRPYV